MIQNVVGIYGESRVDVDIDRRTCAWIIKKTNGAVLCSVPWRWLFDSTDLGSRDIQPRQPVRSNAWEIDYEAARSRWESFDVAVATFPLTAEDLALLEASYPGITSQRRTPARNPGLWERADSFSPPRQSRIVATLDEAVEVIESPSPPRQSRIVATLDEAAEVIESPSSSPEPPEHAPEYGERKLLL